MILVYELKGSQSDSTSGDESFVLSWPPASTGLRHTELLPVLFRCGPSFPEMNAVNK